MIKLNSLIINPEQIEYIHFNGNHEGRDCITVKLTSGEKWYLFGNKKFRDRKMEELSHHLKCNVENYPVLQEIKMLLNRKRGRKCEPDELILKKINNLT